MILSCVATSNLPPPALGLTHHCCPLLPQCVCVSCVVWTVHIYQIKWPTVGVNQLPQLCWQLQLDTAKLTASAGHSSAYSCSWTQFSWQLQLDTSFKLVLSLCVYLYLVSAPVALEYVARQIAEPMARTFTRHPVFLSAYKHSISHLFKYWLYLYFIKCFIV